MASSVAEVGFEINETDFLEKTLTITDEGQIIFNSNSAPNLVQQPFQHVLVDSETEHLQFDEIAPPEVVTLVLPKPGTPVTILDQVPVIGADLHVPNHMHPMVVAGRAVDDTELTTALSDVLGRDVPLGDDGRVELSVHAGFAVVAADAHGIAGLERFLDHLVKIM